MPDDTTSIDKKNLDAGITNRVDEDKDSKKLPLTEQSTSDIEPTENTFDLSQFLTSREYRDYLKKIPFEHRGYVIGTVLEYIVLHPDGEGIQDLLREIEDFFLQYSKVDFNLHIEREYKILVRRLYIDSILKKIPFQHMYSEKTVQEMAYDYFVETYVKNGKYFHGFNGTFEQDIRTHGLTTDMRMWDWDEIKEVDAILKRVGVTSGMGWGTINSESKISVTNEGEHVYAYAVASPEWFAQFVAEGSHIFPYDPKKKQAFYRRDYTQARQNILEMCDRCMSRDEKLIREGKAYPNLTIEEKTQILEFFEKYWCKFAGKNSEPRVAIIPVKEVWKDVDILPFSEIQKKSDNHDVYDVMRMAFVMHMRDFNRQIDHNISPSDIEIIKLPDYNDIY